MADRVYPAKPPAPTAPPTAAAASAFPVTKSQLYGANRPAYRHQPQRKFRRSRRSCCCRLCFWITLIILSLLLLAAIDGAAVYVIYHPHRPDFTVSGLKISTLNVTSSSQLGSNIAVNITARNPNKKIVFTYNPIDISVFSDSDGSVSLGTRKVSAFMGAKLSVGFAGPEKGKGKRRGFQFGTETIEPNTSSGGGRRSSGNQCGGVISSGNKRAS